MNQQSKISALEAKNEDLVFELRKNSDIIYSLETWKKESTNLLMVASTEKEALEARVKELEVPLNTCKNDYWFMANLLEKYSSDKEQAIKDCIERMKYRAPMFKVLHKGD